ncbi:pectate lyase superfamily protein-domain-containing protein [Cladorrhinum sp. PSN332]|nr:pectate lyase superfamily protein-domain-containing protein [Cladorrhinum sp. PSN332]
MHSPSLGSLVAFSALVSGVIARATVPTDYAKLAGRNISVAASVHGQYPFKPVDPPLTCDQFWFQNIDHEGRAPYAPDPNYKVWRNVVTDFGAVGDGVHDDTKAINDAISAQGTCAPGVCTGSTRTPALIYFPPGTYLVSDSIVDYYYVQLIGNPCNKPIIKAASNFNPDVPWILDGNQYQSGGAQGWISTNVFWRQVANFVFDTTAVDATREFWAIHWPSSQATSISNVEIRLSEAANTNHRGIFIENGSGGYIGDVVINGGFYGLEVGNQQYTFRGISIFNAKTAVKQIWNWGWTYIGIRIVNCDVGFDFTSANAKAGTLEVGSAVIIDSDIINTPVGIKYGSPGINLPPQANTFSFERIRLQDVPQAIVGPTGLVLAGTPVNTIIETWGRGNAYSGTNGPAPFQGEFPAGPVQRPKVLTVENGDYYTASKPYYENVPLSEFYTARRFGAVGDNVIDDTDSLNTLFAAAARDNKVVYINAGIYRVTRTVHIPPGSRIFGDSSFPQIVSAGPYFQDERKPRPVIQVGKRGSKGRIEWSNTIIGTRGSQPGAILIQYNIDSRIAGNSKYGRRHQAGQQGGGDSSEPSGMWDVHVRIGGFDGSDLQLKECPKTPNTIINQNNLNQNCIAAFLSWHITEGAGGLYQENNWVWVADHDIEPEANNQQITIYAGRGLLIESSDGPHWLVASSVEHHQRYEYQFWNSKNIFAGQIQTETAYYQPNPDARFPQVYQERWHDPSFNRGESGWGLRVVDSKSIAIYGAGLYSFFDNYSTQCSDVGQGSRCQKRIFSVEGKSEIRVMNLNTIGTTNLLTVDGVDGGLFSQNQNGFVQSIGQFTYDAQRR